MIKTIPAKTILTTNKTTDWFGLEYNMNLYKGCCHGCIYCDSRSSCYGVEQFDEVRAKENALLLLRNELNKKTKTGVIGTGAMSDPYNPFEKECLLTRNALELVNAYEFGISIATKSSLIIRDIDLLEEIQEHSPVLCKITITTPHDSISQKIEPRVATSSERFDTVSRLSEQGIYTGVLLMPVLPFLTDGVEDIRELVKRSADSGAKFIYPYFGVTLRNNQRDYFLERLEELYPELPLRYEKTFGTRYSCVSPKFRQLWSVFTEECNRYGLLYKMQDIVRGYRQGYGERQMRWF